MVVKSFLYLSFVPIVLCLAAPAYAAETATSISPEEVDALIQKADPKSPYPPDDVFKNSQGGDLLLATLKKDPAGPWSGYILMWFEDLNYKARSLSAEDREAYFKNALTILKSTRKIIATSDIKTAEEGNKKFDLEQFDAAIARASLEAGVNLDKEKASAKDRLARNTNVKSWNYGNVIYEANSTLGRIALREGKIDEAKKYLLAAGKTPGSPQLNSFGPDFILARALLEKKENATVLEFLDLVERFWANTEKPTEANAKRVATDNLKKLQLWREQIRDGKIPDDPKWK